MNTILRSLCALPLLAWWASSAVAQPPVAANDLATTEKPGVTLYQVSGLKGSIPLKKVYKVDPSGDTGQYVLEFASNNMNTEMEIMAKFVLPSGMTFVSFEVSTTNGPQQVTTAGADAWDDKTLIDKVTVSPWNLNRVLKQCTEHLANGDGTFKNSATFDLEADATEIIRGKGIAKYPNAPPGSASSSTGTVRPRTRVTAYIVSEERRGSEGRELGRVTAPSGQTPRLDVPPREAARPLVRPTPDRVVRPQVQRPLGERPQVQRPQLQRQPVRPQFVQPGRLIAPPLPQRAKDQFERTKPHMNYSPPPKRGR